jgi:hypothetical protein
VQIRSTIAGEAGRDAGPETGPETGAAAGGNASGIAGVIALVRAPHPGANVESCAKASPDARTAIRQTGRRKKRIDDMPFRQDPRQETTWFVRKVG